MLYIAFVKNRPPAGPGNVDIAAKSQKWWNDGDKPTGLKTIGFYSAVGSSDTRAVIVFDAASHEDIRTMVGYWNEVEFEIHPAVGSGRGLPEAGNESHLALPSPS